MTRYATTHADQLSPINQNPGAPYLARFPRDVGYHEPQFSSSGSTTYSRGLRPFRPNATSSSDPFKPESSPGRKSGGNIPCRGVPQTAHASAFNVISAPQHAQKAAISLISPIALACWMNGATGKIQAHVNQATSEARRR